MINGKFAAALLLPPIFLLLTPPLVFTVSAETLSPRKETSFDNMSAEGAVQEDEISKEAPSSDGKEKTQTLPPEERNYTGPCMGEEAFHRTWFDRTHEYLTSMLCQPSVWFDNFFGQHRAGEDWAGSLIQWEGSVRFDEQEETEYRSKFSASFRLPKMNKKMKLVITSGAQSDSAENQSDGDNSVTDPSSGFSANEENRTTAGFRYYLTDTQKVRLNIGAGLKFGDPVQPYLRVRLRYFEPLGRSTLLRLTPTFVWLTEDGFNRSLRIDLDQRMSENVLIRASQSFVREEVKAGIQWGTLLTLYDRLSTVTVLALDAGARGNTYPGNRVERYRVATRLRSNFIRKWLFLEVEPEYYWPRDDAGDYHLYRAVTFKLEMQFFS